MNADLGFVSQKGLKEKMNLVKMFFKSIIVLVTICPFSCLLFLGPIIGAVLWPYSINTWLVYAGKEPQVLWWHGMLIGWIPGLGQICAPLALLTWILTMFIS